MVIETLKVGYLDTNCYILKKDNKCLIIDPEDDYDLIKENIADFEPLAILITHSHFDHIGALEKLKEVYKLDVLSYENVEEKTYYLSPFIFEIMFNPGHSDDSISFYFKKENIMFVGDFVFKNTIGRCDLEGGNLEKMYKSIESLKKYKDLILYPGHGDFTTLEYERVNNPYFN